MWVYGWAPDLIRSTDTTVKTHDEGEAPVDGWLLAAPSPFKVTIRSPRRRSKVNGKSIQTETESPEILSDCLRSTAAHPAAH